MASKRRRTKSRFEDMYALAVTAHSNGWTPAEISKEFEEWMARNEDLVDERARQTARMEFKAMADPRLSGALPAVRAFTERYMAGQPAGTSLRFQHEFLKKCREALKRGVAQVLRP